MKTALRIIDLFAGAWPVSLQSKAPGEKCACPLEVLLPLWYDAAVLDIFRSRYSVLVLGINLRHGVRHPQRCPQSSQLPG
jgi:hypothetical protein